NPAEFNVESQLALGRVRAERLTLLSGVSYAVSQTAKISGNYQIGRDSLESGYKSTTRTAHATYEARTRLRHGFRLDAEMRDVGFMDGPPERSYVGTAGWVYGLSQRTGVELLAGPRFTEGTIRPEVSAMIRHRLPRAELSAGYWRTDLVSI